MIDRMVEFVHMLRASNVRVSMSEAIDAAEALRLVPIASRPMVKLALQSSLIKEPEDISTFESLFNQFFLIQLNENESGVGNEPDAQDDRLNDQDTDSRKDEGEESQEESNIEVGKESAIPAAEDGEQDDADSDEEMDSELQELLARIQVGENNTEPLAQSGKQAHMSGSEDMDLYQELPPEQVESLYDAVEDLAANLVTKRSLRFQQAQYGSVDIKRTVQKSFRTGNIPFNIIRKRRKINNNELVVLCDISGSVWEVARFFLKLVQEMQNQFKRSRSYLFVDRINEVTDLFDDRPFDEIIEQLKDDPGLNFFGLSDFGRAFYQFFTDTNRSLSRNTILVILGDARANWFDPMEWTLDEMQRRTHMVIWLNPEPKQYWDTDDSVMSKYSPYCDYVMECRNLDQLKQVGELILQG
ncbi:MAG: VWA domain-containing protein [Gemmatimonadota bacterium]|nr:VWA domain-containing protein [Gemmatimonadota bacterium]